MKSTGAAMVTTPKLIHSNNVTGSPSKNGRINETIERKTCPSQIHELHLDIWTLNPKPLSRLSLYRTEVVSQESYP